MSELQQSGITKSNFYIPEPKPPFQDPWTLLLMAMSFVIATGFAAYAFMGWMFGEIEHLAGARFTVTIVGAVTLAIGGEFTTPLTVWEVYRKTKTKTISKWDWSALAASVTATLIGLLLGAAGLIRVDPAMVEAANNAGLGFVADFLSLLNLWPDLVKGYAPLILVVTASADGYAHFIETGLRIGSYDRRYKKWQSQFEKWSAWGAGEVGWAERVDAGSDRVYNESVLPEPPVKKEDTPVQGIPREQLLDDIDAISLNQGGNGRYPDTSKLDSGEVKIEDIEYLHPAVARAILEHDDE